MNKATLIAKIAEKSELNKKQAEAALNALRLSFDDIELYAASVGPGSFTGVRIGTALIKGLSFGKNIPCSEVSTLEALAYNLDGIQGIVVPVMDARRGQVYTAVFKSDKNGIERICDDCAVSICALAEILQAYKDTPIYLCGDGYSITENGFSKTKVQTVPQKLKLQSGYSVACCAYKKYDMGEVLNDKEIAPIYLRPSQAERERNEKLGIKN